MRVHSPRARTSPVTCDTGLRGALDRAAIQKADRVPVSGGVDGAGLCGRAALTVPAERAAELAVVVLVHALTDEKGAGAAVTVLDLAGDVAQAATHQGEL